MNLTEEKRYSMSLILENGSTSGLNKESYELAFTNRELLHAIFTSGLPIQRLTTSYEGKRQMEFLHKAAIVETALVAEGDRLKKSRDLNYLDSSEKSIISYYIGMIFSKLLAKKIFGIDYLTHINLIPRQGREGYIDYCGMRRSDLIGYQRETASYSVWEAKGRSENSPRAMENGCTQARSVKSVCGKTPQYAAVCMTYYENSYLTAVIKSPKGEGDCELKFEEEAYFRAYYLPILEFFAEGQGKTYLAGECREITTFLPDIRGEHGGLTRPVTVGIPCRVYDGLIKGEYRAYTGEEPQPSENNSYVGSDYIYIR